MTVDRILELHRQGIQSGGTYGPPRPGCVEGSIGAAESATLYTSDGDPLHLAVYLLTYLARNHCFPDGNKRVAWLGFVDVLLFNVQATLPISDDEAVAFVEDVAQGFLRPEDAIPWVTARMIPIWGKPSE